MAWYDIRKTLNPDGTVDHSMDTKGNWNAAVEMKKQSKGGEEVDSRYICQQCQVLHT